MADWREPLSIDYAWRGALLVSCLVHLCMVSIGLMIYHQNANLPQLNRAIKVALINPQPRTLVKPPALAKRPPAPVASARTIVQPPPVKKKPITPVPEKVKVVQKTKPVLKKKPPPKSPPVKPQPKVVKKVLKPVPAQVPPVVKPEPTPVIAAEPAAEMSPAPATAPVPQEVAVTASEAEGALLEAAPEPAVDAAILQAERETYLALLRGRIERHKKYPLMARKGRQQGVVLVQFELSIAGKLRDCFVKESCGFRLLDRAALQAVKAAAPFPALPTVLAQAENVFVVPVRFLLSSR